MKMARFPHRIEVQWSDVDEVFVARIPALNAAAHGDTPEDATREVMIAAEGILEVMAERSAQ